MRLVTFTHAGKTRLGRLVGDEIVDLSGGRLPGSMLALLEAGAEAIAEAGRVDGGRVALEEVKLEAPISRPPKILAVGLNYADHVAEVGREVPKLPILFNKQSTSVNGPFDPIHLPKVSPALDYEGEFAFVIGRRCRHVPKQRASEVIAGYLVLNDVSVRDWQRASPTMMMGKSFDTHAPMGPAIVTADEVGAVVGQLELTTTVNGEVRQHSNTNQLIFDPGDLIAHVTAAFSLEPGDVITTGTCGGVAGAMDPPKWLVPGDVVRVEIEGLGFIENEVIAEPDTELL